METQIFFSEKCFTKNPEICTWRKIPATCLIVTPVLLFDRAIDYFTAPTIVGKHQAAATLSFLSASLLPLPSSTLPPTLLLHSPPSLLLLLLFYFSSSPPSPSFLFLPFFSSSSHPLHLSSYTHPILLLSHLLLPFSSYYPPPLLLPVSFSSSPSSLLLPSPPPRFPPLPFSSSSSSPPPQLLFILPSSSFLFFSLSFLLSPHSPLFHLSFSCFTLSLSLLPIGLDPFTPLFLFCGSDHRIRYSAHL